MNTPATTPLLRGRLLERQQDFSMMVSRLIAKAYELGFHVTLGEAYRSPEEAARLVKLGHGAAILRSLHCDRLAIDLNLFRGDDWLQDSADHRVLGEWWESIGGSWGGRFSKPDGNHYSLGYDGRR